MTKLLYYILFFIIGILIYKLININDTFSIGGGKNNDKKNCISHNKAQRRTDCIVNKYTIKPYNCVTCDPKSNPPQYCPPISPGSPPRRCPTNGLCSGSCLPPSPPSPSPSPSSSSKTYSFYVWFGREQDESVDESKNATVNPNPPYYYLNNIDFADLNGELIFLMNEFLPGSSSFKDRKYGINVIDKWLVTYKGKLGNYQSMQNTVIGPYSYNNENCPGALNDGNTTNWYPVNNSSGIYSSSMVKSFKFQGICIDNKGNKCSNCSLCEPSNCSDCHGATVLNQINENKYSSKCDEIVNKNIQNSINTSPIVFQNQTLKQTYFKKNKKNEQLPSGVYLTSFGECFNLPAEVKWNNENDEINIPTKCNGSYTFNCSGSRFNEKCIKKNNSFIKSKLRIDTTDSQKLKNNEYFAQYVGSIRLDDLSNGKIKKTNDDCRDKILNSLHVSLCGVDKDCSSDLLSPFWNQKYNDILDFFNNPDNYCSQVSPTEWSRDPNDIHTTDNIYTIDPETGEFKNINQ